jgi:D-sedoheptulose 7-phosphate isomerase
MSSRRFERTAPFAAQYLQEVAEISEALDADAIDAIAEAIAGVRERGGRLFILGAGGGAGHASHAVNDFRKICDIESYAPSDNVSELTARVNDEGWDTAYRHWLAGSRLNERDAILVFSVGGGSREHNISMSLVNAVELAGEVGALVIGIVGKDDGETARLADHCIVVRGAPPERLTPHTEAFQAVVWHLLVSHPALAMRAGTWETIDRGAEAPSSPA